MTVAQLTIDSPFGGFTDRGVSPDAAAIREHLDGIRKELRESMTFGREYRDALAELREVASECASEDWDGYGAKPINDDSCDLALKFLDALPEGLPAPEINADPDGEVCFEWISGPRRAFSISFGPRGELTFAGLFGRSKAYGTEYFGDEIPPPIIENLNRAISK
jgi:hypothetical protein